MRIQMFHNPRCSKSRQTLALLQARGVEPEIIGYLESPPTAEVLDGVLQKLGYEPRQLMRTGEAVYAQCGAADPSLDRAALIALMVEHPVLIERPIVIAGARAVVGRPPEAVLALLE